MANGKLQRASIRKRQINLHRFQYPCSRQKNIVNVPDFGLSTWTSFTTIDTSNEQTDGPPWFFQTEWKAAAGSIDPTPGLPMPSSSLATQRTDGTALGEMQQQTALDGRGGVSSSVVLSYLVIQPQIEREAAAGSIDPTPGLPSPLLSLTDCVGRTGRREFLSRAIDSVKPQRRSYRLSEMQQQQTALDGRGGVSSSVVPITQSTKRVQVDQYRLGGKQQQVPSIRLLAFQCLCHLWRRSGRTGRREFLSRVISLSQCPSPSKRTMFKSDAAWG
ncbi:hypothetical protein RIB2604_01710910 [Aspergillus luchuensis]|uniref:Uncharacterized protein n=1 Tax=Aspergillus kawachii TaxID=1069201 RepID=A0A146FDP0_ASPKA|nr:hypothetical protein RIB2604_01710910 [Aspergillus luchuensis]